MTDEQKILKVLKKMERRMKKAQEKAEKEQDAERLEELFPDADGKNGWYTTTTTATGPIYITWQPSTYSTDTTSTASSTPITYAYAPTVISRVQDDYGDWNDVVTYANTTTSTDVNYYDSHDWNTSLGWYSTK